MKAKKGSLFFLFLCLMGVLTVSASISPLHHDAIGVVYAEADDEAEEDDAPAPATGSNGNYENLQVPSILSTAYADGLRLAELDDSQYGDEASKVFRENISLMLNNPDTAGKYQFDTIGVFMGPIGQSSGSGTNDVASTLSIGLPQLQEEYSFGQNLGESYWTFGRAVQNLRNDASKADTSAIGATAAIDSLSGISTQVANIGIRLLRDWSPAPVVLAFSDSGVLTQAEYQSNELIKLVKEVEIALNMILFFGSSVPGIPELSYSQLITLMIMMFGLMISILTVFTGKSFFSQSVKKAFVKVMVMLIAVPLTMSVYDWGLKTLDEVAGEETQTTEYQQARSHLLLGRWAEKGFAVPAGRTLTVQDGRFILSRDDIRAINAMLVADDDQKIVDEITRQVSVDNNETNISWQAVIHEGLGRPWQTESIISIANELGNGQPITEKLTHVEYNNIGYMYGSGLRASKGTNGNFIYTQNGSHSGASPYKRFGISPVANYNLLNTSFNTNGLSVKSNLSTGSSLPSVAPNAYAYNIGGAGVTQPDREMKGPVKWLVEFTLMIASIKALAQIITTGFGGMLSGGARSMFGSSAGWGELFGAIFAAIFGVIGLSLFSLLALQVTRVLYGTLHTMTDNLIDGSGVSTVTDWIGAILSPTGWISWIPGVSGFFADMISDGLDSLIASVMAFLLGLFLLPHFVKIPIEAFTAWISSLPDSWAQKAQAIENRFTGDYSANGGASGALTGAMANAGGSMLNSGAAVAAGAGMIAGAAVKAGGGAILNKVGEKLGNGKDGGGEDTENKGTESVATPNMGKTDANGNPVTENVSDNEETVEGATSAEENSQEGDAVGGNTESDESVTSDDDRTEGDAVGGDVNAEESSVSDMDSTEGDAVDGDVSAEDSVVSDNSAVEGDSSSEDSSVSDESNAQGDAVSGDVNAEDSSVSDESNVQGDVNDDRSSVSDDSTTQGDVNDDRSSVSDENNTQGNVSDGSSSVAGDVSSSDDSVSGETTSEGDAVGGDTSAYGDSVSSNDSSVAGGTSANNSSVAGGTSSSVAGGTSANNSSVAGGTSSSNSSVAGGTSSSVAGGTSSSNSSVAGGTSSSDSSVAGGTSTNSSSEGDAVGGDVNASNATTGDDVTTSDSVAGGMTSTTDSTVGGESVSEGSSNLGGDTSTSDSTVGSEGSGQGSSVSNGSADSGTNYEAHSESSVGGPASEGGVSDGGTSITNDASTEGAQVSNDTTTADANVTQDASASINQSTEDRTMHQEGNADNRQSADVNSNSQTVNDSQSTVAGSAASTGKQGSATSTGKQGSAASTGKQGNATSTGKQGSATSTGKQGNATSAGKQGSATSTGKQGSATSTGKQGSATSTGKQGGTTASSANGSANTGGHATPANGQAVPKGGRPIHTGKQSGASTAQTGNQGKSATAPTGQQRNATPAGQQSRSATSPTGQQRNATATPTGQQRGTSQGQKGTATIDSRGTVTASNQGPQSKGGNESTSAKAGRLGRMFNSAKNSTAKQSNVSNAQQAAMGAVHMMGGLTGTQNITQKGVDNMRRRQGKDVGAKNGGNNAGNNAGQNASNSPDNERQQQINDMQRREQDERNEQRRNKKPSFIATVRSNKK